LKGAKELLNGLKELQKQTETIKDVVTEGWASEYHSLVTSYIEGTGFERKPDITDVTKRLRDWRVTSGRIPGLVPGDKPLVETGALAMSIVHEPRKGITMAGRPTFTRMKTNKGEALVYIEPINQEVVDKAWFLHNGGYTSKESAIPGQWVPPRPFMTFPWDYHKNYILDILLKSFTSAVINILRYGAPSYKHLIDI
jgi:hypothetical protein